MLGYLIARAMEIEDEDGPLAAITWVAVHAWFESALDTRADLIRRLGAVGRSSEEPRIVPCRQGSAIASSPRLGRNCSSLAVAVERVCGTRWSRQSQVGSER